MVYRAEFNKFAGWTSPWIVEYYAKRAVKLFGPDVTLVIGEAGFVPYPNPFQGYVNPNDLQWDIEAANRGGVNSLQIYSWDGLRDQGLGYWLEPSSLKRYKKSVKAPFIFRILDSIHKFLPNSK